MFVLIKKEDFYAATETDQQDFFQVAVVVHEVDHPEKSLNYPDAQKTIFHKADFPRNPIVSGPKGGIRLGRRAGDTILKHHEREPERMEENAPAIKRNGARLEREEQ